MSLESRIIALAEAIGTDIKVLTVNQGSLSALTTTAKNSLVAALNELKSAVDAAAGASINDSATGTNTTWSSSKISTQITAAVNALVASAPTALDTLVELATALGNDPNYAATVATALGNRVRYDAAQTLTLAQKQQACANIGVGDPDHDFLVEYAAAKVPSGS